MLCVRLAELHPRLSGDDAVLIEETIRELRDQQHEIETDNELLSGVVITRPQRFVSLNSDSKLGRFLRRLELGWSPCPRMGFDEADEWDWRAFL
jgi:hypothetical protein